MKKFKLTVVMATVFGLFGTLPASEICCEMEDEMELCWNIQDIEGFNDILEDWMENC